MGWDGIFHFLNFPPTIHIYLLTWLVNLKTPLVIIFQNFLKIGFSYSSIGLQMWIVTLLFKYGMFWPYSI